MKKALITGITGQDGSLIAELLLEQGYEVHGLVRREAIEDTTHKLFHIAGILDRITLHTGSVQSYPNIFRIINRVQPDECFHLAAESFVGFDSDAAFCTLDHTTRQNFVTKVV